ncbi:MAG TPA: hypothetical protein DIT89_04975 [Planctomycetaceae bacterium]|nr:hypothetical protein [Planctomycetaceae bacterium]
MENSAGPRQGWLTIDESRFSGSLYRSDLACVSHGGTDTRQEYRGYFASRFFGFRQVLVLLRWFTEAVLPGIVAESGVAVSFAGC